MSFTLSDDAGENMQCFLVAAACDITLSVCTEVLNVPQYPALVSANSVLFGSSSICRGLALQRTKTPEEYEDDWFQDALDLEEHYIRPACKTLSSGKCAYKHFSYMGVTIAPFHDGLQNCVIVMQNAYSHIAICR